MTPTPYIITIRCSKPTPEQKSLVDAALQKIDPGLSSHVGTTRSMTSFWVEGPDSYAAHTDEVNRKIEAATTAVWVNFL